MHSFVLPGINYFWCRMLRQIAISILIACTLAGCLPSPYFQKQVTIPGALWEYSYKPVFTFTITDTTAQYQPYFLIQHTQAYPYNNLWVWVHVKSPGDTATRKERINIPLSEPNGKWMGRGMGELYEQRLQISLGDSIHFRKPGTYTLSIEQNMRINPLPDVLHVGFRLEKR